MRGLSATAAAQAGNAAAVLNGTVRDASGAVVPGATITLTNTSTNFKQVTQSNSTGNYTLVNISPGNYVASVAKDGFAQQNSPDFVLSVNQTATINFDLQIGTTESMVQVAAGGVEIETSTSELGTVIGTSEVNSFPLNGRNFTELLLLGPGVSPANASGNAGGGGIGNYLGNVVFPAVNGQNNRSNMFLLDGINNYGSIRDTYAVQPTLDDIQEFKLQSHNDEAQFGQVLGGIVNVVTKSGTNQFHGDLWEFLRNDAFDAANYFNPDKTPLKQNQFGGAIGGPVVLPHYNGRNKTFFLFFLRGLPKSHRVEQSFPDSRPLSNWQATSAISMAQGTQLFNPYSSVPDASSGTGFDRQPFMCDGAGAALPANADGIQAAGTPCNIIPASLLNFAMVNYAKTLFPAPINTGNPSFNGRDTTPAIIRQDQISIRGDQQIGSERPHLRPLYCCLAARHSFGRLPRHHRRHAEQQLQHRGQLHPHFRNKFGPGADFRAQCPPSLIRFPASPNAPADFLQTSGFAPAFYSHLTFGDLIPSAFISGYIGAGNYVWQAALLQYLGIPG